MLDFQVVECKLRLRFSNLTKKLLWHILRVCLSRYDSKKKCFVNIVKPLMAIVIKKRFNCVISNLRDDPPTYPHNWRGTSSERATPRPSNLNCNCSLFTLPDKTEQLTNT